MFGTLVGPRHAPSAAGCDQNFFEICQKMQSIAEIKAPEIPVPRNLLKSSIGLDFVLGARTQLFLHKTFV